MKTTSKLATTLAATALVVTTASIAYSAPNRFSDADFKAELAGENEVPPIESDASGEAKFEVDGSSMHYELEFEDATDMLAAAGAHIHCAPAGENGPVVVFLAGVIPGGIDGTAEIKATLTAANIVDPACGSTIAELVESMREGRTYVNVHSAANPTGEIRGQIHPD